MRKVYIAALTLMLLAGCATATDVHQLKEGQKVILSEIYKSKIEILESNKTLTPGESRSLLLLKSELDALKEQLKTPIVPTKPH